MIPILWANSEKSDLLSAIIGMPVRPFEKIEVRSDGNNWNEIGLFRWLVLKFTWQNCAATLSGWISPETAPVLIWKMFRHDSTWQSSTELCVLCLASHCHSLLRCSDNDGSPFCWPQDGPESSTSRAHCWILRDCLDPREDNGKFWLCSFCQQVPEIHGRRRASLHGPLESPQGILMEKQSQSFKNAWFLLPKCLACGVIKHLTFGLGVGRTCPLFTRLFKCFNQTTKKLHHFARRSLTKMRCSCHMQILSPAQPHLSIAHSARSATCAAIGRHHVKSSFIWTFHQFDSSVHQPSARQHGLLFCIVFTQWHVLTTMTLTRVHCTKMTQWLNERCACGHF